MLLVWDWPTVMGDERETLNELCVNIVNVDIALSLNFFKKRNGFRGRVPLPRERLGADGLSNGNHGGMSQRVW